MSENILENRNLRVSVNTERGWFDVFDEATGTLWGHDPWRDSAGELVLRNKTSGAQVEWSLSDAQKIHLKKRVTKRHQEIRLTFQNIVSRSGEVLKEGIVETSLAIDDEKPELTVKVLQVTDKRGEWEFVSLLYPLRHLHLKTHVDEGYLVVPQDGGLIIPSYQYKEVSPPNFFLQDDRRAGPTQSCIFDGGIVSMPFFGAKNGQSSFAAIIETPDDALMNLTLNYNNAYEFNMKGERSPYPRILCISPKWLSSLGEVRYERIVKYCFLPHGDYVKIAKRYRQYAQEIGLLKTLEEKIKENPEVEKLLGATWLLLFGGYPHYLKYEPYQFTWKDIDRIVRDLHDNLKLKRVMVNVWGGFAKQPPESYPFDESKGSKEELFEVVKTAKQFGFLYTMYYDLSAQLEELDNWDPERYCKMADGRYRVDRWLGGCSSTYLGYAERDMSRICAFAKISGIYIDCMSGIVPGRLFECYNTSHEGYPQSRTKDRENKCLTLDYLKSLGLVVGAEYISAWTVPHIHYAAYSLYHYMRRGFFFNVPLFHLVFHDAVVAYHGDQTEDYFLHSILYGVPPVIGMPVSSYDDNRETIKSLSELVGEFSRRVALDELLSHEFLTDDFLVEKTVFSSGTEVIISKRESDFKTEEGKIVPAKGFHITYPDGKTVTSKRGVSVYNK